MLIAARFIFVLSHNLVVSVAIGLWPSYLTPFRFRTGQRFFQSVSCAIAMRDDFGRPLNALRPSVTLGGQRICSLGIHPWSVVDHRDEQLWFAVFLKLYLLPVLCNDVVTNQSPVDGRCPP